MEKGFREGTMGKGMQEGGDWGERDEGTLGEGKGGLWGKG